MPRYQIDSCLAARLSWRAFSLPDGRTVRCGVTHARLQHWLAVVFSQPPGRAGPSVADNIEHLATWYFIELKMRGCMRSYRQLRWVQHHPGVRVGATTLRAERFELVTLRYDGYRFERPSCEPLPVDALQF